MIEHGRTATRVVLADDAALLREALAAGLVAEGFEVVGRAGDVDGLLAAVERESPDVVIVDVRMPPTHTTEGLAAAHLIRRRHPGMAILVLSQYIETRYALELLRDDPAGVGYVLKDHVSRLEDLLGHFPTDTALPMMVFCAAVAVLGYVVLRFAPSFDVVRAQ